MNETHRARLNGFLRRQVQAGHQCYIVCPSVEEGETESGKAAQVWAETLQQRVFPELQVGLLHGRMKGAEKEAVMGDFAKGKTQILVATTVIEVGVDVPNATVMVVEDADRFGLSQLHQLRGRVGRGKAKSYCFLLSNNRNPETLARLKALCKTSDWLPHRRGGSAAARARRLLRPPAAWPAHLPGGQSLHGRGPFAAGAIGRRPMDQSGGRCRYAGGRLPAQPSAAAVCRRLRCAELTAHPENRKNFFDSFLIFCYNKLLILTCGRNLSCE